MLACYVSIANGRCSCRPKLKHAGAPLCPSSAHPITVHMTWACSYLKTLAKLSSNSDSAEEAQLGFIERLRMHGTPSDSITFLLNFAEQSRAPPVSCGRHFQLRVPTSWIVLTHHHVLTQAGFNGAVERYRRDNDFFYRSGMGGTPAAPMRVSWRKSRGSLMHMVRSQLVKTCLDLPALGTVV